MGVVDVGVVDVDVDVNVAALVQSTGDHSGVERKAPVCWHGISNCRWSQSTRSCARKGCRGTDGQRIHKEVAWRSLRVGVAWVSSV